MESNGIFLLSELQALAELLGAYGMKYLGQKMMQQVASQVGEIKVQLLTPYTLISVCIFSVLFIIRFLRC